MKHIVAAFSILLLCSCGGGSASKIEETTTRGSIYIASDESYKPLIDAELFVFESNYKYAKVKPIYTSEGDAMDLLKNDSVRLVIMSRKLTDTEKQFFKDKQRIPKETHIAFDGLAFISNRENKDTTLSFAEVQNLFTGNIKTWGGLSNGKENSDSVRIVFDSPKSGNARYIKEQFKLGALPANCYAASNNEAVLEYVEKNKNAIGIISSGLIADADDSLSQSFVKRVNVLGISAKTDPQGLKGFVQPYQEYISDGSYPFKRDIYIVNCEIGTRLGTGFSSFVASDKGQRIILKSGLLPAVMPVRFIEVSNEF